MSGQNNALTRIKGLASLLAMLASLVALPAIAQQDFGDTPASYGDPSHNVPASPQLYLGATEPDAEPALQATPGANGDDSNGAADEDGVTLQVIFGTLDARATVTDPSGSNPGNLCAWVDGINGGTPNGVFDAAEGQCFAVSGCLQVVPGLQYQCNFIWNISALPAGTATYARFRSTTDALTTVDGGAGGASDGEVEDYRVDIRDTDTGDAPTGGTVVGGIARIYTEPTHVLSPNLYIGAVAPDADPVSRASVNADGDDTSGSADEDGVALTFGAGVTAVVTATNDTGQPAVLRGWVDGFSDLNGGFGDNESKFTPVPASGNNSACRQTGASPRRFTCTLSWGAGNLTALQPGNITYARFRVSSIDPRLGDALDGEIEDYRLVVPGVVEDRSDAPTGGTVVSGVARDYGEASHTISRNLFLGDEVDDETGSLAGAGADGDDTTGATPDDEDGVTITQTSPTQLAMTAIVTSTTGSFNGGVWWDGNGDGVFDSATESRLIRSSGCTSLGSNRYQCTEDLPINSLPPGFVTYVRLRLTTRPSFPPAGTLPDGEVEDYRVEIRDIDYGDAPASYGEARHLILGSPAPYLGAIAPDAEPASQPTAAANGDDTTGLDDEDGIATLPLLPIVTANYSLPVAVTNATGRAGTLLGWIDLNGDGRFEPAEVRTAAVPGNGVVTTATLTWPNVRVAAGATLYARLRFTTFPLGDDTNTPADERAQGTAADGEVEDYLLSAAPLGSLTVIKNTVGGNDSFTFNTTGLSPASFTLTTAGGMAQRVFPGLLPGNYSVTELLSPAWNLTGATCTGGKDPAGFFLALSENVICTFTNQIPSYSVGATVSGGFGSVSCTPTSVTRGGSGSCTAVPDPGFRVLTWGGDCAAAGSNVQCGLTNILADKISTVSFALIPPATYNVTATVVGGNYGSVGCYPSSVRAGDSSTCIAAAFAGFRVKSWGGACAAAGSNVQCNLSSIQADQVSTVSFELTPPATYNVTATVVGGGYGGSVSCFPGSVKAGESSTCIAVAKAGFRVLHWGGACAAAGSNSTCSLTKIQADQVSTVSFELTPPSTYNVTATVVGGNGSASCYPNSVKAGESSTCIAVAHAGFQVQGWGGACAASGNAAQCSLTNIQADQNSTVSFVAQPVPNFTVSATVSGGNGAVSCAPSPVPQGDSSGCTAAPDPGYQVAAWTGDCTASGQNVHCALSNIQRDQSSTVSFVAIPPNSYSVTATVALGNGSVGCAPNTVTAGGSSACTAVPATGYQVHDWSGACAATGNLAQCNLTNIQANQTSTVSFTPQLPNTDTFTVNATVTGGNGTVSCNPSRVAKGGQSACAAVPATGYQVQAWTGDCAPAGSDAHCYLPKIQKNQTSTVSFAAIPPGDVHVFALVVGVNGTVSCAPDNVPVGGSVTCTATPEAGYRVAHWDGACLLAGNSPQCGLTNLQSDQRTTVTFEPIPPATFSVTATVSGGNGTVSCSPASVPAGGGSTCTAVPDRGYGVGAWTGACAFAGNSPQCALTNVQANQASSVSFIEREPAAIPTLSQWALLLLAALLALTSLRRESMRAGRR